MSLILHLMKKDARYLRYEVAIWLALVLAQAGLVLSGVDARVPERELRTVYNAYWWLWILHLVIGGILAVQLVQNDPLTGTTAFWRTRPVSRLTLLASKMASVTVVLLGVPFVVELATYLVLGISARESLGAAFSGVVLRAVLLSPALAAAVVTADVPRFVVALIFILVAMVLGGRLVFGPIAQALELAPTEFSMTLNDSRFLLFYALVVACGFAVVVHQYLSLKTVRSIVLIPLALIICLPGIYLWPVDFVARVEPPVDRTRFDPDPVALSLDPNPVDSYAISKGPRDARVSHQRLFGYLLVSGGPAGRFVVPTTVRGVLKLVEGLEFASELHAARSLGSPGPARPGSDRQRAMLSALGPMAWSNLESMPGIGIAPALVDIPDTTYRAHQGRAGTFTAEVTLAAYAFETTGAMPVTPGAGYRRGSKGADIASVRFRDNGDSEVMLRELAVLRPGAASWWSIAGQYILVNRITREALFPDSDSNREVVSGNWLGQGLSYLTVRRRVLTFQFPAASHRPSIDAAWLAQSELVRVEPVSLGVFTKPLKVDELPLPSLPFR